MMPTDFISATERHLLFTFALIIVCTLYLNMGYKVINNYNESVRVEQEKKRDKANNSGKSGPSFAIDCNNGTAPWEFLYLLQYITAPISCFLFRKTVFRQFLISLFLSLFSFLAFLLWCLGTFVGYKSIESFPDNIESINQFLLYDSTGLEFVLSILVTIFFALQIFVLLRFVIEKFHVKISLR